MAPSQSHVALAHSEAVRPQGVQRLSESSAAAASRGMVSGFSEEQIQVTVVVRPAISRDLRRQAIKDLVTRLPGERRHLSVPEFIRLHGASAGDLEKVAAFARGHGLVVAAQPGRRCVVLTGTVAKFDAAFGVASGRYRLGDLIFRSHEHPIYVPENLAGIVLGVLGLDDRCIVSRKPRSMLLARPAAALASPASPGASAAPFPFTEHEKVMEEYEFPVAAEGQGQCIGIICLGGGFHHEDMRSYLAPGQEIQVVELDGQRNNPVDLDAIRKVWEWERRFLEGDPISRPADLDAERMDQVRWTTEVTADIQHALRFARGARIMVYFAPNTPQGKYTAFTTALVDELAPSVLSCSSGTHEDNLTRNYTQIMDDVFSFAALRGVTICCSSGDDGDGTLAGGKTRTAHFPASSPHVLACGGTMPSAAVAGEVVWKEEAFGASGGGVSRQFNTPWWQSAEMMEQKAGHRGRGVPDVAGKADIRHGYRITVGGIDVPIGGTSSTAPMWAGLISRINQELGRSVGFVNALLYTHREQFEDATRSIIEGNNGSYRASPGWDACTGWGTPRGTRLLKALTGP